MDTKWKNRWMLVAWLLLFSHGLSGIMTGFVHGRDYIQKDYFQTDQFEGQLQHFIDLVSVFEWNYIPKEEAKKLITVTAEEIEEHRYRYGDLAEQISNIKAQYEDKIQQARAERNQEVANAYIAERDRKIEDITMNFQSDEHVRAKIVKEKEQKIDDYYREMEFQRADFVKYKGVFLYYVKDTETGKVYTNVNTTQGDSKDQVINPKDMAFIRTYPSSAFGYLSTEGRSSYLDHLLSARKAGIFEGQIAVPKSAVAAGAVLPDYYDFQHQQKVFYLYTVSGITAFLISLYLLKKIPVVQIIAPKSWQSYYNRVPLDVRAGILAFSGLLTLFKLVRNHPFPLHEFMYDYLSEILFDLGITAVFIALTLVQGKYLFTSIKDETNLRDEWQKSILYRTCKGIQQAFLIRRIGTQVFILLSIVFVFGAGSIVALMKPVLLPLYALGLAAVALPILFFIVKRTGYFNQIVLHTSELARGNLEPDLPVKGKSALATLAGNINLLKHGVKTSQKEQAKSERLKTELITNVSHDLRTPLTSIITYTELLKTPHLSEEERNSYIEIIDRKSKRLKVLIDDLFEASKMASGSVELMKEKVDLVQLLQQALAEYADRIDESSLQFRVTTPDTPVYALVDGQKLWRVFDNLIGNILKYSLENTRVYISVKTIPNQVVITFKNVTKYELGENIEELFERFKRGDTSRHTEGSGLGLAIAKSIIDLHEGSLEIEVDGDLFKVTVFVNTR
ncbi:histidine kinase dimerization/phospho-acceptor domain-containing protein [Brevibacillus sp. H7]|uniref:histidine kinase dimerization/phospho-acceptor domain-containing protein n=1 Tax=Brevibacillus sp. H7 TaxID=3349138 RepID=UPI0037FDDF94